MLKIASGFRLPGWRGRLFFAGWCRWGVSSSGVRVELLEVALGILPMSPVEIFQYQ